MKNHCILHGDVFVMSKQIDLSEEHVQRLPGKCDLRLVYPVIYPAYKCLNAKDCWHFNIYEQDKFQYINQAAMFLKVANIRKVLVWDIMGINHNQLC